MPQTRLSSQARKPSVGIFTHANDSVDIRDIVRDGQLVLLGVTQEQHPDRCQLFAQWKEFDWPILHDPTNWMESTAVPTVVDDNTATIQIPAYALYHVCEEAGGQCLFLRQDLKIPLNRQ
ncbi:MAG: hypothetical protein R3E01_09840 [Pirellulaceae bacterium]|nr:hypothetical protein [Planctomycetales bacterium]